MRFIFVLLAFPILTIQVSGKAFEIDSQYTQWLSQFDDSAFFQSDKSRSNFTFIGSDQTKIMRIDELLRKEKDNGLLSHILYTGYKSLGNKKKWVAHLREKIDLNKLPKSCSTDHLIQKFYFSDQSYLNLSSQGQFQLVSKILQKSVRSKIVDQISRDVRKPPHSIQLQSYVDLVKDDVRYLAKNRSFFDGVAQPFLKEDIKFSVRLKRALRRRQCQQAASVLKGRYSDLAEGDLIDYGKKIAKCFKRRSRSRFVNYWNSFALEVGKVRGAAYEASAKVQLAIYYWNRNEFTQAKEILAKIIERKSSESRDYKAKALFYLGKIEENQGNFFKAKIVYDTYLSLYSHLHSYPEALMNLMIVNAQLNDWSEVQRLSHSLESFAEIKSEEQADPVERSFALFWRGMGHYHRKNMAKATKVWTRLAKTGFSSYYGAMGAFLVEKFTGKEVEFIEPSQSFDFLAYLNSFDKEGQNYVKNVFKLLAMGEQRMASCDARHMNVDDRNFKQSALKSLALYVSGDWLSMVKNFSTIPRYMRREFPAGMESILFPRKYHQEIDRYSKELGVDPEFILAIIRQESIFNPRAKSWAGARGLMQLMPQTARHEGTQLNKNYMAPKKRRDLKNKSRRKSNLFNEDTNLALGIHHVYRLFNIYENPLFVLTSYNASPRATKRWRKNIKLEDWLLFIERIPYDETRKYVKLVFRNYYYYKKWYKKPVDNLLIDKVLLGAL